MDCWLGEENASTAARACGLVSVLVWQPAGIAHRCGPLGGGNAIEQLFSRFVREWVQNESNVGAPSMGMQKQRILDIASHSYY